MKEMIDALMGLSAFAFALVGFVSVAFFGWEPSAYIINGVAFGALLIASGSYIHDLNQNYKTRGKHK